MNFTVMTWNIAEQRDVFPWAIKHSSDILCLQEATKHTSRELASNGGYVCCASTPSHCGFTQIYVAGHLAEYVTDLPEFECNEQLAGCCGLELLGVRIVSIHLAPFAENANVRAATIIALDDVVTSSPCIIAGDTNMLAARERLPYTDVSEIQSFVTPDDVCTINKYENANWWSSRLFGKVSALSRYDRIHVANMCGARVSTFCIEKGQYDAAGVALYKSDHYGVVASIEFDPINVA